MVLCLQMKGYRLVFQRYTYRGNELPSRDEFAFQLRETDTSRNTTGQLQYNTVASLFA